MQAMQIDGSDYVAFIFVSFHHSSLFSSDHICISYVMDPSTRLHMGCTFQEKSMWFILNEQLSRVSSKLVSIVKKKSGQIVFDETHERNAGKLPVVPFLRNCGSNAKDET